MSTHITVPPDVEEIFSKAGYKWTSDERYRVWEWLNERPQLQYLLGFASRHLGNGATREDVEETWSKFNLYPSSKRKGEWVYSLEGVMNSYDPNAENGRRFWNYLLFCFKLFCHDEGKRIRRRHEREGRHLYNETEEGEHIEVEFVDKSATPQEDLEKKEEQSPIIIAVRQCINELPQKYRVIVRMYYFKEMSMVEIAMAQKITENYVKQLLFRARQQLARCLREKLA